MSFWGSLFLKILDCIFSHGHASLSKCGKDRINSALIHGLLKRHGVIEGCSLPRELASVGFLARLNEMGFHPDWIERQLAHDERKKVRAAYNHAQYLPERRRMMQQWADYLDNLAEDRKVIVHHFGRTA